ncbi:MAG TPA: carboxypeptidase regulatory-like domain-containing protein [Candidatus Acidoferrum sp.]|nr:carboxypeptidase regulatory-like domain-containing protein [Candidatus Acidoferrum sp.]
MAVKTLWGAFGRAPVLCLSLFFLAASLHADVTATLQGFAHDPSSAAMPNVKVSVTNVDTNLTRSTVTDVTGEYRFLALPVGTYTVEAELSGFQKFVATNIVLTVDQQRRVDITLQVGSLQQRVEISASAVQVETASTQLGTVIDAKSMVSLPLNGRSYIDLLSIQAGVAPEVSPTGLISVNGQREASNAFLVNGGDVSEGRTMGAAVIPNLDAVAEFRLVTNSFDAEYGRFSGAVMNAITKSGTNGFHGSAFEFLRNSNMDARAFFDPAVTVLKRNQFGYAIGGPALKSKVFWFTDYQGTRQRQGSSASLSQLPSVAQRNGTFAPGDLNGVVSGPYWAQILSKRLGYAVTANEPYSTPTCATTAVCVFPGGVIPASAISPISANLLKGYIPLPNAGTNTFLPPSVVSNLTDDKIGQRVDINTKKTGDWYAYYHFDDSTSTAPGTYGPDFGNFGSFTPRRAQQAVLTNTKVFGPSAVNEARVDFTRIASVSNQPTDPGVPLSSLGFVTGPGTLGIVGSGPDNWQSVPPISLSGQIGFSFGRNISATGQFNNTWHVSDSFSKIWKSHSFKFGGEYRYLQINERNIYAPNGNFTFDGSETGHDVADFLLGAPSEYIQAAVQVLDSRTRYGAAFAQDSWRIKPNFTVNFGLRWEVSMPWYDTQNKIETIVPGVQSTVFPGAPKGWLVPGDPGLPGGGPIPSTLAPTTWKDFAPRLGLAWSPNVSEGILGKILGGPGKTSIRAAAGIYYTAIQDAGLFVEVADAPYGLYWVNQAPVLFDQPFVTRADGSSQTQRFPFNLPVPGSPSIKNIDWSVFLPITSSPGYQPGNKLPYGEHYNFTIQRQIASSTVLSLAYVGTQGHKLFAQYEANPGNAALCLSLRGSGVKSGTLQCGPNQENSIFTRPDGSQVYGTRGPLGFDFGSNTYESTNANSSYNSLQVTLERRARSMTFLAAYTFSKSMDTASGFNTMNFSNFNLSRSLSAFDATHNFVISYNYELPFATLIDRAPKRLTQGWSLNGITRFATGFPIALSQTGDRSLTGAGGVDRPDYIGGLVITPDVRSTPNHQYFNKEAFTSEVLGAMGNANPRFFHGPGINNWDAGLQKVTRVRERMSVQFRAEFFNTFEHAQFGNPNGSFTSANFGRVTSAKPGRIGQMSLKFLW